MQLVTGAARLPLGGIVHAHRELVADEEAEIAPGVGLLAAALCIITDGLVDERHRVFLLLLVAAL